VRNFGFKTIKDFVVIAITVLLISGGCKMAEKEKFDRSEIIEGEVVVGFEKGVSQTDAEALLSKYNLEFIRTGDVNMGKAFFYETGEKFIVKVSKGKEEYWMDKLEKERTVKKTGFHVDPTKMLID